jgi:hypothetical protein
MKAAVAHVKAGNPSPCPLLPRITISRSESTTPRREVQRWTVADASVSCSSEIHPSSTRSPMGAAISPLTGELSTSCMFGMCLDAAQPPRVPVDSMRSVTAFYADLWPWRTSFRLRESSSHEPHGRISWKTVLVPIRPACFRAACG